MAGQTGMVLGEEGALCEGDGSDKGGVAHVGVVMAEEGMKSGEDRWVRVPKRTHLFVVHAFADELFVVRKESSRIPGVVCGQRPGDRYQVEGVGETGDPGTGRPFRLRQQCLDCNGIRFSNNLGDLDEGPTRWN